MKKLLMLVLVISLCTVIVGCKNKNEVDNVDNENNNQLINSGEDNNVEDNEYANPNDEKIDVGITVEKSENEYAVIHNDTYKTIYEFDGEKLIGCRIEYQFATEAAASEAFDSYQEEEYSTIGIIDKKLEGSKVILYADITDASNNTRTEIENVYDALASNID